MYITNNNNGKMTAREFVYWLQGFMELSEPKELTERQVTIIKDHIKLVMNKETPDYDVPASC